ncbi:PAS domain-containing sensor histidine kinase [Pedobacter sp. AW31-3R]|uniref:PAS domain-containing sensor histidine kinase n=1 Tax=Pedobacter sp. AW31-3R TaxID=3445781 RepID=UPI003FA05A0C
MAREESSTHNTHNFLTGEDICSAFIRNTDWSHTSLGAVEDWPKSLKTTLNIVLNAQVPMFLFWGPNLIQFFNTALVPVFGQDPKLQEFLGQPGGDLWMPDDIFVKVLIDEVLSTGTASLTYDKRITIFRNGRSEDVYWSCSYNPVIDDEGSINGVFITCFEVSGKTGYQRYIEERNENRVSAMMKTHLAVFNAEERLRLATEATGIGSWDIDLRQNTIIYTPTLMELFGLDRDTMINLNEISSLVHPEDKAIVDNAFTNALVTGQYRYEARLLWPDESVHWISTNGRIIFDEQDYPSRLLGTTIDITENKIEQLQKNDFIAIASHELKTPLTSIKAYLQMLKMENAVKDPEYVLNIAGRAEKQVIKMTKLIYSFLDMSRIESGNIDLSIAPFMIDELIQEVIKDYLIHTNSHQLLFTPGITEPIEADRSRIGQVIDNLISNAIKYSPLSKSIEISSTTFGEEAVVSVRDHGIGIDTRHQEKVFERFYRADDQKARNASGFGIGLYLSADILKRHHGGIWVESDHGNGSTFHFSLPLTRP